MFGVEARAHHGAAFEQEEEYAREAFVDLLRVEVVYDGVLDVVFEQQLDVARNGAQLLAQPREAPLDEVVRDVAGGVRALARLLVERERRGALVAERVVDGDEVRD